MAFYRSIFSDVYGLKFNEIIVVAAWKLKLNLNNKTVEFISVLEFNSIPREFKSLNHPVLHLPISSCLKEN